MLGILYIVGTPIGNLEDITFRAVRILQEVDLIAAEDTRHTGKLLQHFQITTPQISYHHHNRTTRLDDLLKRLDRGDKIALVTDAGMPGISDPGWELVRACWDANIQVIPIPGVTAVITALAASGLPTERFVFEGFLPTKNKCRKERFEELISETRSMVFYEAPHRLLATLKDLAAVFGDNREIVLARELTKLHEEFLCLSLSQAIALYESKNPKGEYTLIVAGAKIPAPEVISSQQIAEQMQQLLANGMTRSQASRHLAKLTSLSRQEIYQIDLSQSKT
jgi:16S rRNA (cytidine1402-2'-O)-methyltransferase